MEKREASYNVGGNVIGAATMENSTEVPQKIKNRTIIICRNSTSGYLSEENKLTISQKISVPHVHYGITYKSQDMERT